MPDPPPLADRNHPLKPEIGPFPIWQFLESPIGFRPAIAYSAESRCDAPAIPGAPTREITRQETLWGKRRPCRPAAQIQTTTNKSRLAQLNPLITGQHSTRQA